MQKFIEIYSKLNTTNNDALEVDRKTILDLCAHMFHQDEESSKENSVDEELRYEQFESEDLIFECFQDEVNY